MRIASAGARQPIVLLHGFPECWPRNFLAPLNRPWREIGRGPSHSGGFPRRRALRLYSALPRAYFICRI
jgi:hypothetical protein